MLFNVKTSCTKLAEFQPLLSHFHKINDLIEAPIAKLIFHLRSPCATIFPSPLFARAIKTTKPNQPFWWCSHLWPRVQSACEQGEGWSSAQNLLVEHYAVPPKNAFSGEFCLSLRLKSVDLLGTLSHVCIYKGMV